MTQAFNLSQLANNLNTSGQLDATDGLVNAVPVANGGTGASTASAARTNLGVPATGGTGATGTWPISISGNAATASASAAFATANWTIEQSGTNLIFKYNGATVATISNTGVTSVAGLSSSGSVVAGTSISATTTITAGGNITATGTVTANGS